MSELVDGIPIDNHRAIRAFVAISGGLETYLAHGGHLTDLAPLLDADTVTLRQCGLLDIADIMEQRGDMRKVAPRHEDEPLISPQAAREWMLSSHGILDVDGQLIAKKGVPHIAIAGIAIASGTESRYLSEVYKEISHHRAPLSDEVLLRMAKTVVDLYEPKEE